MLHEPRSTTIMRRALMGLSRILFLPWFHHGSGPWTSRWGGWICVLRTRGRRSGLLREAPLDYAPTPDGVVVLAGFGEHTRWLGNVRADPRVEVQLHDRTASGVASEVVEPRERLAAIRDVLCHCGLVGYVYGFSPFTVSDERLERVTRDVVAVRVVFD